MKWSIHMGAVRGIPIRIHLTFVLLLILLFARTGIALGVRAAALELAVVLLLFACVVLHELGHAAVARWHQVPITSITLYPFGGVARLGVKVLRGPVELRIAAAGPAVNLALASMLWLLGGASLLQPRQPLPEQVLAVLFWANLMLAGFNLLPAFPLDGGRVLRGALTPRFGRARATVFAASLGQIAAIVAIGVGIFHQWWLILAGALILPSANSSLRRALAIRQLETRTIADVMIRRLERVAADDTLESIQERSRQEPMAEFVVAAEERFVGYLPAARIWAAANDPEEQNRTAGETALPLAPELRPETSIPSAYKHLESGDAQAAPVRDADGELQGVVTRPGLLRSLTLLRALSRHGEADDPGAD